MMGRSPARPRWSWTLAALLLWAPLAGAATAHGARSAKASGKTSGKTPGKASGKTPGKASSSGAKGKPSPTGTKGAKPGKGANAAKLAKVATKGAKTAPAEPKPPPMPTRASGKVAVFLFDGDGAPSLRARVVRLLRARGLKVTTNLRPVDSAEQYREMADALNLAAFLDGEASEDGDQASVTIYLRSGVSGLRIASATLASARRTLPGELDKSLWPQLGPPLARVCVEAAKPRKREREPMRIEAGTPLENSPAEPSEPTVPKGGT
jgi:hypothetical protein